MVTPARRFALNNCRKEMGFRAISRLKDSLRDHPLSTRKRIFIHALIVLLILTVVGVSQFRSYGISYDEPAMRMHGIATAKYVADIVAPAFSEDLSANPVYKSIQDAATHQDGATHQVFFELGLVSLTAFEPAFNKAAKLDILFEARPSSQSIPSLVSFPI